MDNFLPKPFDINVRDSYCSELQYGTNKTTPHWHSGAEIIYVIEGEVRVMFNDCWQVLKKDSMIFIPPKQIHCCDCNDKNARKIVIGFLEKAVCEEGKIKCLPHGVKDFCIIHGLENTELPVLVEKFNKHYINRELYADELSARGVLLQIYAYLINYWSALGLNVNNSSQNEIASAVYEYIEAHFREALSPYDIARRFNVSYSGLAKIMRDFNHTSFIKCVNQVRIENSKRLLAQTSKNITDIGLECGFSDTSYFIKIFRQITDMTPNAYKKLITPQSL